MLSISRCALPCRFKYATPVLGISRTHPCSPSSQIPLPRLRVRNISQRHYSSYPDRNTVGVFTPKSAALFVATGIGLFFYFRYEKSKLLEQREKDRANKQYGRPQIGGPFALTTQAGQSFAEQDLLGKWSLLYFGFTNCPDICPQELDKMTAVLNVIEKEHGAIFRPVFISVDPARDSPSRVARYLQDFHPSFLGLVGSYESTKAMCKAYRVYFSTPPDADPAGDYLVDHSIFVYLMDPDGKFVEAFGQNVSAEAIIEKINEVLEGWRQEIGRKKPAVSRARIFSDAHMFPPNLLQAYGSDAPMNQCTSPLDWKVTSSWCRACRCCS